MFRIHPNTLKSPKTENSTYSEMESTFVGRMCRGCMRVVVEQDLRSIWDLDGTERTQLKICDMLQTAVPLLHIQDNDQLPEWICSVCLNMLNISYHFQAMCIETDKSLRAQLLSKGTAGTQAADAPTIKNAGEDACTPADPLLENPELILKLEIGEDEGVQTDPLLDKAELILKLEIGEENVVQLDLSCPLQPAEHLEAKSESEITPPVQDDQKQASDFVGIDSDESTTTNMLTSTETETTKSIMTTATPTSSTTTSNKYICGLCDFGFASKFSLKRHFSRKHKKFSHKEYLEIYLKSKHSPQPTEHAEAGSASVLHDQQQASDFVGIDSDESTTTNIMLTTTETATTKNIVSPATTNNKYICGLCDFGLSSRFNLNRHFRRKHALHQLNCHICNKMFTHKEYLEKHLKAKHSLQPAEHPEAESSSEMKPPVQDDQQWIDSDERDNSTGPKIKHTPSTLKRHRSKGQEKCHTGAKSFACIYCDKSFERKFKLTHHLRIHTGEKPYLCPQCGKTFSRDHFMRQHLMRHTNERRFPCPECPSRFNCVTDQIKHMSSHRGLKPHVCDICGSRFTRGTSLNKHKQIHTGERPHKCQECNMTFVFIDHMRRHMRTHTGEKPFKCKFCDRAYGESGDLTKHLRSHVGEKTYICTQCPEAFKYLAELRIHVAKHYKEEPQHNEEQPRAKVPRVAAATTHYGQVAAPMTHYGPGFRTKSSESALLN